MPTTEKTPLVEPVANTPKDTIVPVNTASITEMKIATDDAVIRYFTKSLGYSQNHFNADLQLVLGFLASGITLYEFYYSWKHPGVNIRAYTIASVVIYFSISAFLAFWAFFKTKNLLFVGAHPTAKKKVSILSSTIDHTPTYLLVLTETSANGKTRKAEIRGSLGQWFHEDGYISHEALEAELAKLIK